MINLKEKYRRYQEWMLHPHQVAPLSEEMHQCATCDTCYEGNYCPRCGQSAKIGRYSFKNAFLLYLDVWGLGNRGMFRTLRDLIVRPGYMIRDYLRGMQMAYFPPFKMFFLLVTLSLLVDTGLNIRGINRQKEAEERYEAKAKEKQADDFSADVLLSEKEMNLIIENNDFRPTALKQYADKFNTHPAIIVGRLQHLGILSFAQHVDSFELFQ